MNRRTGLEGISQDGNVFVQTKRGGGYLLYRREVYSEPWELIGESRWYADACAMLDQVTAQVAS